MTHAKPTTAKTRRPRALERALGLALGLAGLALAATASAEQRTDLVLAEMGEPYFRSYCASCHGLSGEGDGPAAETLRKPPADLTLIAARRDGVFPDAEIAQYIDGRFQVRAHGSREMPIWGERLGRDIPDSGLSSSIARGKILVMVEYLKSIQVTDESPAEDAAE